MKQINIDDVTFYIQGETERNNTVRKRLIKLIENGFEEVGIAQFGIPGHTSGLYIEKVWSYTDKELDNYIGWALSIQEANNEENRKNNILNVRKHG